MKSAHNLSLFNCFLFKKNICKKWQW